MAGTFDNYARALWELHVPENRVSEAAELLKDNPVLWEALKNPVICLKEKERIIDRIFPEEMRGFFKDSLQPWKSVLFDGDFSRV